VGYVLISFYRCCSYVGRIGPRYVQPVSLANGCGFPQAVHEIGHVLGFWHEQSRPDRDEYINVHQNNILAGRGHNFDKESTSSVNSLGVTYDFNSIMHYSEYAFSKDRTSKTLTSKEAGIPIGRSSGLSPLDIKQTNLLYRDQCSKSLVWCTVASLKCKTHLIRNSWIINKSSSNQGSCHKSSTTNTTKWQTFDRKEWSILSSQLPTAL